ncbi:hypothetical protein [Paraburkholderia aspalathi]|uniref:hypothetical protein n=1 Tax=Paraburkholderia aspalathi TaxID=1324617 RepID=UPI0038BBCD82
MQKDLKALSAFKVFLNELKNSCPESYRQRYDTLCTKEVVVTGDDCKEFFAYHDGKVVGVVDYSEDLDFPRGTVANSINGVLDQYQGMGLEKSYFRREMLTCVTRDFNIWLVVFTRTTRSKLRLCRGMAGGK